MIKGRITCDKCGESWELDLVLDEGFCVTPVSLSVKFEVVQKALGSPPNVVVKRFHICGRCLEGHREKTQALFDEYFEGLR